MRLTFNRIPDPINADELANLIGSAILGPATVEITPDEVFVEGLLVTEANRTSIQNVIDNYVHESSSTTPHGHVISEVTDLQNNLDAKAGTSHTHTIADVTNLQTSLDAKSDTTHTHNYAPTSHTHAQADITNLTSDLAGKASTSHSHVTYAALAGATTAMGFGTNTTVKITPAATATFTTTVPVAGTEVCLIILTSGTVSRTITFGTGFKAVGTLATGTVSARVFVIRFVSDGTNLYESSRTAAIVA